MEQQTKKVVVIGGGITGLTTAYYLQQEIREKKLPIEVKLVEATHRLGGKVQTFKKDGYVIEKGPDSCLSSKSEVSRLAGKLGMEEALVRNRKGTSFVIAGGELYPIPGGSIVGIPTQIAPFITTSLFSLSGKMRAAADFILPRSQEREDQSLGRFFRRRMGDEVVDHLIEPLLTGIFAGDIDQLSLMSTFPQLYELEQKHRSLIAGIKKSGQDPDTKEGNFITFTGGLQSLIDAMEERLDPNTVHKGMKVTNIEKEADNDYTITFTNGEKLEADCVIVTTPHHVLQSMFPSYPFLSFLKDMPATSVATVAMGFSQQAVKKDIAGTEFLVSRNSDYSLTAGTWTHKKWPHTAPEGKALLRCYLGKSGDETIVDLSDDHIEQIVLDDLSKIMDIEGQPDFTIVTRYKNSMPQYTVGHLERIQDMHHDAEARLPGIFIAGSSYDGLSIPDCIGQGEKAVSKVLNYLK
ncbi:protoporphyrinogen oxidase [Rossellomorea aquimaris]|uniref:protoporphyrinogen oxidase n=1 Tax=Rossellomorea TaxID=2837508 RepID=UPI001CD68F72|nr:protoporphyrinogen oxidase [Rossellomorea aquimaris]MCA1059593.1 protoporphyrinogen oxidase [Rossellomorea aquimaris]